MKKTILLGIFFCLAFSLTAVAERKEMPTVPDLFKMMRRGVICVRAQSASRRYFYITGVVIKGGTASVTVATSLLPAKNGYDKIAIVSDKQLSFRSSSSKKGDKVNYDFKHNLLFASYKKLSNKFGSFGDRALVISDDEILVGQKVFIVNAVADEKVPHKIIPAIISGEVSPKGRNSKLYTINAGQNSLNSLIGSPVVNRMGEIVGIINTDLSAGLSKHKEVFTDIPMVHPARGMVDGSSASDKFPSARSSFPRDRNPTGHWLPVRFGPLTLAWKKALDLEPKVRGVVVTCLFPEGSGCGLKVGDVITGIEGFPIIVGSWGASDRLRQQMLYIRPKNRSGSWSIEMKVIRNGEQQVINVSMSTLDMRAGSGYNNTELGVAFLELNKFYRVFYDLPDSVSGVICSGMAGNRIPIALLRGLGGTIIKKVNGKSFKNIQEFKELLEGTSANTFRFLVLDLGDFKYKYITVPKAQ